MRVEIYVEGAGNPELVRQCRRAFKLLLEKAGCRGSLPSVIPCGGRDQAYRNFVNAPRESGLRLLLLVDSEASVTAKTKWEHVAQRAGDGWPCPDGATEDDLHFMSQCMESWFLADRPTLSEYFGKNFHEKGLPANPAIESIPKGDVMQGLKRATTRTSKGEYQKGRDSFELLSRIRPETLGELPFAQGFLRVVRAAVLA